MSPVYKFSNAGGFTSKQRYTSFLAGNPFTPVTPPDTGAMFPLQVITVGPAGASSITITNIPNTYTHLQLRMIFRNTASSGGGAEENTRFRFNGDTGNNYSSHAIIGNGSSASAWAFGSDTLDNFLPSYSLMPMANSTANVYGAAIMDILDYANTNKFKTVRVIGGNDRNGAGYSNFGSASWRSTSAITSITTYPQAGNYAEYSQFALYGVKAAS